jgi:hypothetical protein
LKKLQDKGIGNIFNKIVTENSPNLKKYLHIKVWEASRTQAYLTKIEPLHDILSIKQVAQQRTENNTECCKREKMNNV